MRKGLYGPTLSSNCCTSCGICLDVCPFYDHATSRDHVAGELFQGQRNVQHHQSLGYYLRAYVGHSLIDSHRERGASGGMATWMLERLLASCAVDRVIAVGATEAPNRALFEYRVCESVEQVRTAGSSKYYPVEVSTALGAVWKEKEDHRYAIIGLPCTVHAIRRATLRNPRLARRVRFVLGIVCNHCPGSYYTELLCATAGISTADVRAVDYRYKMETRSANDFHFRAMSKDGDWSRPVRFQGQLVSLWNKQYFAYSACSYCEDVFAEAADAVFMDAWLERFLSDTRGTSIVVARNTVLLDILEGGRRQKTCALMPCEIEEVVASQQHLVRRKKETIRDRIEARRQSRQWLPQIWQQPADMDLAGLRVARQEARTIRLSKWLWPFFRRMPSRWIPVFRRAVDTAAGDIPWARWRVSLRATAVKVLRAVGIYAILKKLLKGV